MNKTISVNVSEELYQKLQKGQNEAGFDYMSDFIRGIFDIVLNGRFSEIKADDVQWTKYLYVLALGSKRLLENFESINPDNLIVRNYLKVMVTGLENFINSIVFAEDYKISLEDEGIFVDAINIFFNWIDTNKLTPYNIKKFADRMKQQIKEK